MPKEAPGRPPYEGPFRRVPPSWTPSGRRWLSPWRLYALGAIAALALTAFYLIQFTFSRDLLRSAMNEPAEAAPPRGTLGATCLPRSGALPMPIPHSPFCTGARPPACRNGDAIQVSYSAPDPATPWVWAVALGADLRASEITGASRRVRVGATDAPLAQWKVRAARARSPAALVGLFSREPLAGSEVAAWLEIWRRGRILQRVPEITPSLAAKGTTVSVLLLCLGQ